MVAIAFRAISSCCSVGGPLLLLPALCIPAATAATGRGVPGEETQCGGTVISGTGGPGGYKVDRVGGHGDEVTVGKMTAKTVDTSGHTPVALSLIFPGTVFSGDALFAGSVGGTSSPETYEQQLENIRKNLFTLPGEYEVHTGHGPSTTIGIEREFNPFFV